MNQLLAVLAAVKSHAVRSLLSIVGYMPLATLGRETLIEGFIPNYQIFGGETYGHRVFSYVRANYKSGRDGKLLHQTVNVGQIFSTDPSINHFEENLKGITRHSVLN